jgi:hypothetical protein
MMTIDLKDRELLEAATEVGYKEGETFFGGKAINDVSLSTVQSLIKDGANVNVQDGENGSTPLIHAVQNYNLEIADFLIKAGADINMPNRSGVSPLHMACIKSTEAVTFLLKRGADYDLRTIDGISIIEWAETNSLNEAAEIIKAWKNRVLKKNQSVGFLRRLFGKRITDGESGDTPGKPKIDAPKGVYCVLCKSRYSIDECIEPRVPEARIITFRARPRGRS